MEREAEGKRRNLSFFFSPDSKPELRSPVDPVWDISGFPEHSWERVSMNENQRQPPPPDSRVFTPDNVI